ncbi:VgrG-related protein [Kitasatospora sp. NPDC058965]|uniref:VgrG-related protein n=1 Tax=Kitasatospora sp. NPDC058965 TaxID=3346682 RepID=UPI00368BAAA5
MTDGANVNSFVIGTPGPLPPLWRDRPMEVRVEEGGGLAAVAEVRVLDPERKLLGQTSITIGGKFTVQAKAGPAAPLRPMFAGEVIALEADFDGAGTYTTIRALDVSHRLQRGRRIAGYPMMKASEIVVQLAGAAGVALGTVDATSTEYEYLTQPNVSDWEFLRTLALENGRELVVEDGVLNFRKPVAAAEAPGLSTTPDKNPFVLELGKNVLAVRSSVNSVNQVGTVRVRGWDVRNKLAVNAEAPVLPSPEQQFGLTPAQAVGPFPKAELLVADTPYRTEAEATAVATALAADQAAALGELDVTVRGTPELRVGTPVTLTKAGAPFDGKYTVTAVAHHYLRGIGYETRLTVSGRQDRTLFGLAAAATAPARSPRVPSVATGIVVDVLADGQTPQDGYPGQLQQGWVKLKFPWLSDSSAADARAYQSDWVRVVQLGGLNGGGLFCPEIGDEVLVAFEQGLLDRPYVLGGLYNGHDDPTPVPGKLLGAMKKVARRTVANRDGDRLELLSNPAADEGLRLATGDGRLTVTLDRRTHEIRVQASRGAKVSVVADGDVDVQGRNITLGAATGRVSVHGEQVSIGATAEISINAPLVKLN